MAQQVKNPPAMQETQETRIWSLSGEDPWRRAWQPTVVFLPGKSHGQRSLTGCGPWGCKESDTTEALEHTYTTPWVGVTFLQFTDEDSLVRVIKYLSWSLTGRKWQSWNLNLGLTDSKKIMFLLFHRDNPLAEASFPAS